MSTLAIIWKVFQSLSMLFFMGVGIVTVLKWWWKNYVANDPKPTETPKDRWILKTTKDNPFDPIIVEIAEIRSGWVKYHHVMHGEVISTPYGTKDEQTFYAIFEKIEN